MNKEFEHWVHTENCHQLLLSCADYVVSKARRSTIRLDLYFWEETNGEPAMLSKVVASHLWEFLKEKYRTVASQTGEFLAAGDSSAFMTILADRFISDCLDERRTVAVSPAYAYYRHLRHVLSKSEEVSYKPTRHGSFYAFSFDSLQNLPEANWNLSYHDWPRPAVPAAEIHATSGIMKLSRSYWDEACARFLDQYFLPIKELNRFVRCNYALGCEVTSETQLAKEDGHNGVPFSCDEVLVTDVHHDTFGSLKRQTPRLECDIIETELEALALDTLAELSQQQKIILERVEDGATLEEIASELGVKGTSNVHYHLKKAYLVMKRKWSLWGPPSLTQFTEVEEEEFFIFYDKVIEICKNGNGCRSNRKEPSA